MCDFKHRQTVNNKYIDNKMGKKYHNVTTVPKYNR